MRATADRGRLEGRARRGQADVRRDALRPGAEAGRKHPVALDAAAARSRPDFAISRRSGWTGSEDVHFREGMTLTPVSVGADSGHEPGGAVGQLRARDRSRIRNASPSPPASPTRAASRRPMCRCRSRSTGTQIETKSVTVAPNASASVTFAPFTLAEPHGARRWSRPAPTRLPADNTFDFVLTPSQPVSILIVDSGTGGNAQLLPVEGARRSATRPRSRSRWYRRRASRRRCSTNDRSSS